MDQKDLVKGCIDGDPAAWRRLVDDFGPWILHVAKRSVSGTDAEDVTADVFRLLLENDCAILKRFQAPYNFRAWLAVITRRTANRILRRKSPGPIVSDPEVPKIESAGIDELLGELPPKDALLLRLFYVEELSYEEISDILGMPVASIGKHKFRIMEQLKELAARKKMDFSPGSGGSPGMQG